MNNNNINLKIVQFGRAQYAKKKYVFDGTCEVSDEQ